MRPSYQQKNYAFALWVVLSILTCLSVAKGQTIVHVPAEQPTIQLAINAAANADTVLVAPGTYKENINFSGKPITVTSSGGPQVTIIDGGQVGAVVPFSTGEGLRSLLTGFTIRNWFSVYQGGGILVSNSSPTITGNVIVNNQSSAGAGVTISFGSPLVRGNVISQRPMGVKA